MQTIIKKIQLFFINLWNFRKIQKFKKINEVLEVAVHEQQMDAISLMKTISKEMRKFFPKGKSKYIPLSIKKRTEIYYYIESRYGREMKKYNVDLNLKLEFI